MCPASKDAAQRLPVEDFAGTAYLDFDDYVLEDPKFDVEECRQRGITYAAPMRVTLRLTAFEVDPDTEAKSVIDIKEQDVYMGDMPLMTENGTFFINGTERVIVSQMHRSPGVLFDHDRGKTHASGKYLFAARVIPYRGSWLDFEFDAKDIVNVRIDRKRKLPVTALLYALGMNSEEILNYFYNRLTFVRGDGGWKIPFRAENWRGAKPMFDIVDANSGEVVFPAGQKISPRAANKAAKDGLTQLLIPTEEIFGRYSAYDLINEQTGEIYVEAGDEISAENLEALDKAGVDTIELLDIDHVATGPWIRNTLKADKAEEREQALSDIYRVMRPGEPPTLETAEALFAGLFFDPDRYDLSAVGRVKLNMRLDLDCPDTVTTLRTEDIGGRQDAGRPEGRQGRDRRYRQSRQPSCAFGGRTAGEPVSRRPAAHGACGQGAHVVGRRVDGDAERPDQRQARGRRGARVLRVVAAVAVHGPDQPAVRSDAQASRLGARAGRSDA